ALDRVQRTSYDQAIVLADRATGENYIGRLEDLLDSCTRRLRGWEWHRLWHLAHPEEYAFEHKGSRFVHWSPDGKQLITLAASGGWKGQETRAGRWEAHFHDAATGKLLRTSRSSRPLDLTNAVWSPDHRRLAVPLVPQRAAGKEPALLPVARV